MNVPVFLHAVFLEHSLEQVYARLTGMSLLTSTLPSLTLALVETLEATGKQFIQRYKSQCGLFFTLCFSISHSAEIKYNQCLLFILLETLEWFFQWLMNCIFFT